MLALPRRAIDDRNAVRLGVASRAPAEPAGQPDKMGVTQGFVRFRQSSPPHGETARTMPRPEIAIQNDAIHAIVAAVKQLSIEFAQSVCHGPFSRGDAERRIHHTQHTAYSGHFVKCGAVSTRRNCPAGATFPQPCLGEKRSLWRGLSWKKLLLWIDMNQYTWLLESSHYQNNDSPNKFRNLALMDGHFKLS